MTVTPRSGVPVGGPLFPLPVSLVGPGRFRGGAVQRTLSEFRDSDSTHSRRRPPRQAAFARPYVIQKRQAPTLPSEPDSPVEILFGFTGRIGRIRSRIVAGQAAEHHRQKDRSQYQDQARNDPSDRTARYADDHISEAASQLTQNRRVRLPLIDQTPNLISQCRRTRAWTVRKGASRAVRAHQLPRNGMGPAGPRKIRLLARRSSHDQPGQQYQRTTPRERTHTPKDSARRFRARRFGQPPPNRGILPKKSRARLSIPADQAAFRAGR